MSTAPKRDRITNATKGMVQTICNDSLLTIPNLV